MEELNMEEMEMEAMENILVLNDADGNEVEFEYLASVDYEGNEYIVLLPTDENDSEVVILQVEPINEEEESYISVADEDVLYAVYEIFKDKFKEYFTFSD